MLRTPAYMALQLAAIGMTSLPCRHADRFRELLFTVGKHQHMLALDHQSARTGATEELSSCRANSYHDAGKQRLKFGAARHDEHDWWPA